MWSVQSVDVVDTVLGGSSNDVVGTVCRRG